MLYIGLILLVVFLPFAWRLMPIELICRHPSTVLVFSRDYFVFCVFSLFAKVAKVDGQITPEEVRAMVDFMNDSLTLSSSQKRLAQRVFTYERTGRDPAEHFAELFYRRFKNNPAMLTNLVDVLLWLAMSDREFSQVEDELIQRVAQVLQVTASRYCTLRESNLRESNLRESNLRESRIGRQKEERTFDGRTAHVHVAHSAYRVLDSHPGDTWDVIKSRYHKLIKQHHPDLLASKKLPKQIIERANRRAQEIVEAFDELRKLHGVT